MSVVLEINCVCSDIKMIYFIGWEICILYDEKLLQGEISKEKNTKFWEFTL